MLRNQLFAALQPQAGASGDEGADPWRFRSPLRLLVGEAWRSASQSDFATLRTLLGILIEAQEFVRPDLPEEGPPEVEAAREVHYATWILHIAEAFLRPAKTEARLRDRRCSASERKVLRVLFENKRRSLRRKEIQEEMEKLLPPPHLEGTRISQILSDLWNERLLTRMLGPAQGNPQTSFFALSRQGIELCRELGIANPQPLFETDEANWRHLLRRTELASNPERPEGREQIAAFYRPRPGVGCSLTLAHCAVGLAQNLPGRQVLILNLEGEESSLPDHLRVEKLEAFRGFAGLVEDYHAQPEDDRHAWLESNLLDERYACRVRDQENLFYLPAFQHKSDSDASHAYAALLETLRREIELQPRGADGMPKLATEGFLGDLRAVLHSACAKTLIQSPCGLGPGAYLACVLLAEELGLFLRPEDDQREGIRKVLRVVMGTALWRREAQPDAGLFPFFVFSRLPVETKFDPAPAIDRLLVRPTAEEDEERGDLNYRVVRLHDDERLSQSAVLLDLSNDRSLLGKGYWNLIEMLHPDSSFIPSHYKREDEEMEMMREQEAQPEVSPSWDRPVPLVGAAPLRHQHTYAGMTPAVLPLAPAAATTGFPIVYFPQRPNEDLKEPIQAAVENSELSRAIYACEPVLVGAGE